MCLEDVQDSYRNDLINTSYNAQTMHAMYEKTYYQKYYFIQIKKIYVKNHKL